jgi:hypothetical protein
LVTSVRGIALVPTTAPSVALGFIGFMKAALGLRFLPAFFAFFFAIRFSSERFGTVRYSIPVFTAARAAVYRKMPNPRGRVNDFQRENAPQCRRIGEFAT